jgi:glycosyltransferase involved in cell wall biosynthesis
MSISVIIPTYNRAHTLARALDSVFAQHLPALEVIVVDDGSEDDTHTLIKDSYPQCHYLTQSNQGVSQARNVGIRHAKGQWLALLDSDDSWLPHKLEKQMAQLTQSPGTRLCHTNEIWIRNGKRVNPKQKHTKQGGQIFHHCLALCVISPSATLLHRSLIDDYGLFDTDLPACEDYDLWLRICSQEEVTYVEEPLIIKYGGHKDQLSRRYWGMDRFRVHALQKLLESQVLSPENRLATIQTLIKKCHILSLGAEKRGHLARASHYREIKQQYEDVLQPETRR